MFSFISFNSMRLAKVKEIFRKEILDTLRDRRTLMIMIVVPVLLYPGLMIFVNEVAATQQAKMEQKKIRVALVNIPDNSSLVRRLRAVSGIEIVQTSNPLDRVREGSVEYVLVGPRNLDQALQEKKTATLELHYDRANDDAVTNIDRIRDVIDAYSR